MDKYSSFSEQDFTLLCDDLALIDPHIRAVITEHGYPPLWTREPSFETFVHIILEQQVSLASAKAALVKLKEKIGAVTPKKLLQLSDEELKACYFSRQKIAYVRHLAQAVEEGRLSIDRLQYMCDDDVRKTLTQLKGIGNWTVDVFLMMVLHRTDLFPAGDIALMNSVRHVKQLAPHSSQQEILLLAEAWRPNRTVAAFIFWHAYIKRKNLKF